jgi:hypothetical protein
MTGWEPESLGQEISFQFEVCQCKVDFNAHHGGLQVVQIHGISAAVRIAPLAMAGASMYSLPDHGKNKSRAAWLLQSPSAV